MSEGCSGHCESCGHAEKEKNEDCRLRAAMGRIRHKVVVLSGKGGVGKSTVAVNLATALALQGRKVGLLDVDVHGPSVPKMLGVEAGRPGVAKGRIQPVEACGIKVMSVGFLLDSPDTAVIWRGPMKIGVIRQFLADVEWGDLDYLVVDSPPGTGDEPLTVCQSLPDADGAVVVTTPQAVAAADVAKSLAFCRQLEFPVLGIVENMSGFVCPHCGKTTDIFSAGAGEALAAKNGVPLLGRIPVDPRICACGDDGRPFVFHIGKTPVGEAFLAIARKLLPPEERGE